MSDELRTACNNALKNFQKKTRGEKAARAREERTRLWSTTKADVKALHVVDQENDELLNQTPYQKLRHTFLAKVSTLVRKGKIEPAPEGQVWAFRREAIRRDTLHRDSDEVVPFFRRQIKHLEDAGYLVSPDGSPWTVEDAGIFCAGMVKEQEYQAMGPVERLQLKRDIAAAATAKIDMPPFLPTTIGLRVISHALKLNHSNHVALGELREFFSEHLRRADRISISEFVNNIYKAMEQVFNDIRAILCLCLDQDDRERLGLGLPVQVNTIPVIIIRMAGYKPAAEMYGYSVCFRINYQAPGVGNYLTALATLLNDPNPDAAEMKQMKAICLSDCRIAYERDFKAEHVIALRETYKEVASQVGASDKIAELEAKIAMIEKALEHSQCTCTS